MKLRHDVVVIGSGVGGYPAATYLARRGLSVAVVEEDKVGGECTNYGCVPSKALYHVAEAVSALEGAGGRAEVEWSKLVEWSSAMVAEARSGIEALLESYGVKIYRGRGVLRGPGRVEVGGEVLEAGKVLLALGTDPADIPAARFDGRDVISNRELFYLGERPRRLLVIGGGVIGVEAANAFAALGTEVALVQKGPSILNSMGRDVSLAVKAHLAERGVKVFEGTTVVKISRERGALLAKLSNGDELEADKVLVAVGRRPRTSGVGLQEAGVRLNEEGYVVVGEGMATSVPGIYAAGDVVGGPLLAHKAIVESVAAAMAIAGERSFRVDYRAVPEVIFCGLEVARVGYTERELEAEGIKYRAIRVPLGFLAAARIKRGKRSFAKFLMSEDGAKIYGIYLVAPNASEAISAFMTVYLGKLALGEVAWTPYPHLTISEALRDVAEYLIGEPVHIIVRR
ncbi:MAG: NAD(P)/FAD-dependent oxidoreductase [Desulfurococcaceae archaeon]